LSTDFNTESRRSVSLSIGLVPTIILFLLYCSPVYVHAQVLPLRTYTVKDGLPSNQIICSYQDERGYLLIGTGEGLSVFDGLGFTNYSSADGLAGNVVVHITGSRRSPGTVYIATSPGGINIFKDGTITAPRFGMIPPLTHMNFIYEDPSGTLWCGTGEGLFIVRNDTVERFPRDLPPRDISSIIQVAPGELWFGNNETIGIISLRDSSCARFAIDSDPNGTVTYLYPDTDGSVLAGTFTGRILRLRGQHIQEQFILNAGSPINFIIDDQQGGLWIGSTTALYHVPDHAPRPDNVIRFGYENGLPEEFVTAGLVDNEGNLWFGSLGKGLTRLLDPGIVHCRLDRFDHLYNTMAVEDRYGHLWAVARDGLLEIWRDRKNQWRQYFHENSGPMRNRRNYVMAGDSEGQLWIGVENGDLF